MENDFLEKLRNIIEGQIDFEGQSLVQFLSTTLLISVGLISFIIGIILEDITCVLYLGLGGSALIFFLVVPPWSCYRNHPITWLPVKLNEKGVNDLIAIKMDKS